MKKKISVAVDEETLNEIQILADEEKRSVSNMVEVIIDRYLLKNNQEEPQC